MTCVPRVWLLSFWTAPPAFTSTLTQTILTVWRILCDLCRSRQMLTPLTLVSVHRWPKTSTQKDLKLRETKWDSDHREKLVINRRQAVSSTSPPECTNDSDIREEFLHKESIKSRNPEGVRPRKAAKELSASESAFFHIDLNTTDSWEHIRGKNGPGVMHKCVKKQMFMNI